MEISGKVLREVEFRDRLRGYDTDEVDEFLEKVAVAIDELRTVAASADERVLAAERRIDEMPVPDDESIRRTLVLAQRTANLAIKEAREEAAHLLDEAHAQSAAVVAQAQDAARRLRDETEQELHDRVSRLSEQKERLEHEVHSLGTLLAGERERLTEALSAALRFVEDTLSSSDDVSGIVASRSGPTTGPTAQRSGGAVLSSRLKDRAPEFDLPDLDEQVDDDVVMPLGSDIGHDAAAPGEPREGVPGDSIAQSSGDPDEELWARWAEGAAIDSVADVDEHTSDSEGFNFDRPKGNWTA